MFEIGGIVAILIATVAFIGGADQSEVVHEQVIARSFTLYDDNNKIRALLGHDGRNHTTKLMIVGEDGASAQIRTQFSLPEVILKRKDGKHGFHFEFGPDGKPIIHYADDKGVHRIDLPQGEIIGKPTAEK